LEGRTRGWGEREAEGGGKRATRLAVLSERRVLISRGLRATFREFPAYA